MNVRQNIKLSLMWWSSIIHRNHKSKLLYYHDVCEGEGYRSLDTNDLMGTNIELFKKHVQIINEEGYRIVPRITAQEGEVAILLDDGFRGIWDNRQFFYANNIMPTVFLPVDYIGQVDKGILSLEEILELQQHGFIFECHSWSHERLDQKTDEELKKELRDAKAELSKLLSKRVTEICLPLGYFTDHLLDEVRKYGYEEVYSCIPGAYHEQTVGGMRRRNICQFATPTEFRLILRGGLESLCSHYEKLHHHENY